LTTQSVHSVGGKIFAQIWHVGRVSHPSIFQDRQLPVSGSSKRAVGAAAFGYDRPPLVSSKPARSHESWKSLHRLPRTRSKQASTA
jgi:2,4-dienoyl-CoA reductase-like NADH-dependent reductase (Old Yellow Enzyme family)